MELKFAIIVSGPGFSRQLEGTTKTSGSVSLLSLAAATIEALAKEHKDLSAATCVEVGFETQEVKP